MKDASVSGRENVDSEGQLVFYQANVQLDGTRWGEGRTRGWGLGFTEGEGARLAPLRSLLEVFQMSTLSLEGKF